MYKRTFSWLIMHSKELSIHFIPEIKILLIACMVTSCLSGLMHPILDYHSIGPAVIAWKARGRTENNVCSYFIHFRVHRTLHVI